MTKSVWDRLAEMPAEKRENFLKSGKNTGIRVKNDRKSIGSAVYSRRSYEIPENAVFGDPDWLQAD